jgi:hypothetical protein
MGNENCREWMCEIKIPVANRTFGELGNFVGGVGEARGRIGWVGKLEKAKGRKSWKSWESERLLRWLVVSSPGSEDRDWLGLAGVGWGWLGLAGVGCGGGGTALRPLGWLHCNLRRADVG